MKQRLQYDQSSAMSCLGRFTSKGALCLYLLVCAGALYLWAFGDINATPEAEPAVPPVNRHLRYSYTLQNKTPHLKKNIVFRAWAPAHRPPAQHCTGLDASHPFELETDPNGNQILAFIFDVLAPFSTKVIHINAEVRLAPGTGQPVETRYWLGPSLHIETDHPAIQEQAARLSAADPRTTAKNCWDWVAHHIRYTGYNSAPQGARRALEHRAGDCTESAHLFVALTRARNIPARAIGGYVCNENIHIRPSDYHNWAEFYMDGAWHVADPQGKKFMENQSAYVAFNVMGGPENDPGFYRYHVNTGGIRVKMNS